MTRPMAIVSWLVVGHAVLGGLYWGLLQIPESNVLMLALSALTVLVMLAWAGVVQAVGVLGWSSSVSATQTVGAGARRAVWIVPALVLFGVVWYVTAAGIDWHEAHRSEIDAWFIARIGWTDVSWLHATLAWVLWFARYVIGGSLGAAVMAAGVLGGVREAAKPAWVGRALDWRTLVLVAFALFVGIYLPWAFVVEWRPRALPPTWVQPAFAAAKLAVVFVVMNLAWAIVLGRAARQAGPQPAPELPATAP